MKRHVELSDQAKQEVANIDRIWSEQRLNNAQKGPYLFGEFSLADAFFAPVIFRFVTYVRYRTPLVTIIKPCSLTLR